MLIRPTVHRVRVNTEWMVGDHVPTEAAHRPGAIRDVVAVKPIPEGKPTITPYLTVRGAGRALAFYREAFGAEETCLMSRAGGGALLHAAVKIGEASVYLCDEFPDMGSQSPEALGGSPVVIHLYVEDVDAAFDRAVAAGAPPTMPPADMFWGDRFAKIRDPFGHCWSLASQIETFRRGGPGPGRDLRVNRETLRARERARPSGGPSPGARGRGRRGRSAQTVFESIQLIRLRSRLPTSSTGCSLLAASGGLEAGLAGAVLQDPLAGELAGLDLLEDLPHLRRGSPR